MHTNKQIPKTWFDNEDILELRKKVQKSWEKEEFWAWYFLRRFSIYISKFIAEKTKISPNFLTFLGIVFGLLTSICFLIGTKNTILLGIFLYQVTYLLDCIDGEVARITSKISNAGAWLDLGLRYTLYLSFISIIFSFSKYLPWKFDSILLYVVLFATFSSILCTDTIRTNNTNNNVMQNHRKKTKTRDGIIFLLASEPGFYFGLFFIHIYSYFYDITYLGVYWTVFHLLTFFLKSLYRIRTFVMKNNIFLSTQNK